MNPGSHGGYIAIDEMTIEMDRLKGTVEGLFPNVLRGGLLKPRPTGRVRYRSDQASHHRITMGQS